MEFCDHHCKHGGRFSGEFSEFKFSQAFMWYTQEQMGNKPKDLAGRSFLVISLLIRLR